MQSSYHITSKDIVFERFPVIYGQNQFQSFLREIKSLCENDKIDFESVIFPQKDSTIYIVLTGEGSGVFRTKIHVFVNPKSSTSNQSENKYFLIVSSTLCSGTRVRPQLHTNSQGRYLLRFIEKGVIEPVLTIQISHATYS